MKKIINNISTFSGYRHNRYDGFNSDWALLIAAGGNGTADCFVECNCDNHTCGSEDDFDFCDACKNCDCDGDYSIKQWFNDCVEPKDFDETVFQNLSDEKFDELTELKINESTKLEFYCGTGSYVYDVKKIDANIFEINRN